METRKCFRSESSVSIFDAEAYIPHRVFIELDDVIRELIFGDSDDSLPL